MCHLRASRVAVSLLALGLIASILPAGSPVRAQSTQAPERASEVPAGAVQVTEEQAIGALREAQRYASVQYSLGGESFTGMPFRLSGKTTVDAFLDLVRQDPEKARAAGIDASGLVVAAFRAAIPGLRLFSGARGTNPTGAHVTSRALFDNSVPITIDEARPGDLLFFVSRPAGEVTGVAIVSGRVGDVVRVVVASAAQGRVIDAGIRVGGDYWNSRVAGLGRLYVPAGATTPAQTAPSS